MEFADFLALTGRTDDWNEMDDLERLRFLQGMWASAWCWAWWRDGVQYVGAGTKTLDDVREMLDHERKAIEERIEAKKRLKAQVAG